MRKTRPKKTSSREPQHQEQPTEAGPSSSLPPQQAPTDLLPWPRHTDDLFGPSQHTQNKPLGDMAGGLELPSSGIPDYTSNDVLDLFRRFIDLPSEDESDDPDFRPQEAAGEEDEWVAESDTASGDEEVVIAHNMTTDGPGTSPTYEAAAPSTLHFALDPPYWNSQSTFTPAPLPSDASLLSSHQRGPHPSSSAQDIVLPPASHQQQHRSQDQGQEVAPTPVPEKPTEPVKRGRGRPRKHPRPDDAVQVEPSAKKAATHPRKTIAPEDRHRAKLERNRAGVQRRKTKAQEDAQRVGLLEEQNQVLLERNRELEAHLAKFGITPPAPSPGFSDAMTAFSPH